MRGSSASSHVAVPTSGNLQEDSRLSIDIYHKLFYLSTVLLDSTMARGKPSEANVERAVQDGWKVVEQREHTTLLEKRSFGSLKMHAVVFLLTVWWTAGIGNVVYAMYKSEEIGHRRLKPEDAEESVRGPDTSA